VCVFVRIAARGAAGLNKVGRMGSCSAVPLCVC
jgi:hypothetical protein